MKVNIVLVLVAWLMREIVGTNGIIIDNSIDSSIDSSVDRWIIRTDEYIPIEHCNLVTNISSKLYAIDCVVGTDVPFEKVQNSEVYLDLIQRSLRKRRPPTPAPVYYYSWGLDRIYGSIDRVSYGGDSGRGTTYYSVDTGVQRDLTWEFGNRVKKGINYVPESIEGADCYGHGTHTTSTATGKNFGIAKLAAIVPVTVLNCRGSGSISNILLALEWIKEQATTKSVIGMSIGFSRNLIVDEKLRELVDMGYIIVASAGNSNIDVSNVSPGGETSVVSVCATDPQDVRAYWSNYGRTVDICAPGVNICAAVPPQSTLGPNSASPPTSPEKYACISGTSMSQPHVAGVLLHLWSQFPMLNSTQIVDKMLDYSLKESVKWLPPGMPNKLVSMTDRGPAPILCAGN